MAISCPGCGKKLAVPAGSSGKKAKCRQCTKVFAIPLSEPAPSPVPEQPLWAEVVEPPTQAHVTSTSTTSHQALNAELVNLFASTPLAATSVPPAYAPAVQHSADYKPAERYSWRFLLNMGRLTLVAVILGLALVMVLVGVVMRQFGGDTELAAPLAAQPSNGAFPAVMERSRSPLNPDVPVLPEYQQATPKMLMDERKQPVGETWIVETKPMQTPAELRYTPYPPKIKPVPPGMRMRMRVFRPLTQRPLPCVLLAHSGSSLLCGADLDAKDSEHSPEALAMMKAGVIVVLYSLDGSDPGSSWPTALDGSFQEFKAAQAGVLNGHLALEYALHHLGWVDRKRVYCAGSESGATVSLLLAAHEPRIRGCLASAPCTDVELKVDEYLQQWNVESQLPGVTQFARDSSPGMYVSFFRNPVYICLPKTNPYEPVTQTRLFVSELEEAGNPVKLVLGTRGAVRAKASLVEEFPRAMAWFDQYELVKW